MADRQTGPGEASLPPRDSSKVSVPSKSRWGEGRCFTGFLCVGGRLADPRAVYGALGRRLGRPSLAFGIEPPVSAAPTLQRTSTDHVTVQTGLLVVQPHLFAAGDRFVVVYATNTYCISCSMRLYWLIQASTS